MDMDMRLVEYRNQYNILRASGKWVSGYARKCGWNLSVLVLSPHSGVTSYTPPLYSTTS
jgi:hypothetical protein